ncbi:hypothetical protein DQ353_16515 [Arthrobacter sp. AQ5-05]|nr:hypothetical protein DQ353_16515 [Arthrobacter sp. AQ5-05]
MAFHVVQAPLARTGLDGVGLDPPDQLVLPDIGQYVVVLDAAAGQVVVDSSDAVAAQHGPGCHRHPAAMPGHLVGGLGDQCPPGGPVPEIRHRFTGVVAQHEPDDLPIEGARARYRFHQFVRRDGLAGAECPVEPNGPCHGTSMP